MEQILKRTKALPERVPVENSETASLELELHGKLVSRCIAHCFA